MIHTINFIGCGRPLNHLRIDCYPDFPRILLIDWRECSLYVHAEQLVAFLLARVSTKSKS